MTDTPKNLSPCPPHQWRYAAIAGHFSCLKYSERVAPFDPRYRELADEWEADGVEKALTSPMSDARIEAAAKALYDDWVEEDCVREYVAWDQLPDKDTWRRRARAALAYRQMLPHICPAFG